MNWSIAKEIPHDVRSLDRWRVSVYEHATMSEFLNQEMLKDGIHVIGGHKFPIEFHLRVRQNTPIIFLFHANTPRNDAVKLPVFQGLNITSDMNVSVAAFSDSGLYNAPDLGLAWHAGVEDMPLQNIIPNIILKIIQVSLPSKVIMAGGSGGGFAALFYASRIPNVICAVWNPQTNILDYAPFAVIKYANSAFGISEENVRTHLPEKIICDISAQQTASSAVIFYMQNSSDWHIVKHLNPFLSANGLKTFERGETYSGLISPKIWLELSNWGTGHVPPPPETIKGYLHLLTQDNQPWTTMTQNPAFKKAVDLLSNPVAT